MDPPLGNGSDSEEESLGPRAYQWTLSLLSDDKKTAPTRFELFHARKKFEDSLRRKRRLIAKEHRLRQILQMQTALRECSELLYSEIIEGFSTAQSKHLFNSKVLTRSMTANTKKFLSEFWAIWTELLEKNHTADEIEKFDDLGQFPAILVRDLNQLKKRIMATKQLKNQVFQYLES